MWCASRDCSDAILSTGLPLSIREVTNIEVLEPPVADLRDLWGILPTLATASPRKSSGRPGLTSDRQRLYSDSCCLIPCLNGGRDAFRAAP